MLVLVMTVVSLNVLGDFVGEFDLDIGICWPGCRREDADLKVHTGFAATAERLLVRRHLISGKLLVFEHLFQVVREAESTLGLQFGQHVPFGILACTASHQEPSRKILLVEGFKDIFPFDETEELETLFQLPVEFSIFVTSASLPLLLSCISILRVKYQGAGYGFQATAEQCINVFCNHFSDL